MNLSAADWRLVAAFLATCRSGSLSAAARRLGLSQPTVRRHVEELEARLGAALLTRHPSGLAPTATARLLLPHAETMEAAAAALLRAAFADGGQVRGTVRLTCSEVHGTEVLPHIFASLLARHPELSVELVPSNDTQNLLRRDADVAVRIAAPSQGALVARRMAPVPFGLFATPALVERHGLPPDFDTLAHDWPFVGDDRRDVIAEGLKAVGLYLPQRIVLRTDSDLAQLAAIRIGAGACQAALGEGSGLVRLLPEMAPAVPAWVVMHEDLRRVARVHALFDHLVGALS